MNQTEKLPEEEQEDHFDICCNACSATACTGLIPSLPDDQEVELYQEVYEFLPQAGKAKKEDHSTRPGHGGHLS